MLGVLVVRQSCEVFDFKTENCQILGIWVDNSPTQRQSSAITRLLHTFHRQPRYEPKITRIPNLNATAMQHPTTHPTNAVLNAFGTRPCCLERSSLPSHPQNVSTQPSARSPASRSRPALYSTFSLAPEPALECTPRLSSPSRRSPGNSRAGRS